MDVVHLCTTVPLAQASQHSRKEKENGRKRSYQLFCDAEPRRAERVAQLLGGAWAYVCQEDFEQYGLAARPQGESHAKNHS